MITHVLSTVTSCYDRQNMGDHTIELPTLHLLEEFLMSTFSVADIPEQIISTSGTNQRLQKSSGGLEAL
jgi:hypothetical protein